MIVTKILRPWVQGSSYQIFIPEPVLEEDGVL